jgi:hypothetical protein
MLDLPVIAVTSQVEGCSIAHRTLPEQLNYPLVGSSSGLPRSPADRAERVGFKGPAIVDVRDIGKIAVVELIRREQATGPLPLHRTNLVGPDTLTGSDVAVIWLKVLGAPSAMTVTPRVRAESQKLHAALDGLHALNERALSERWNDPREGASSV